MSIISEALNQLDESLKEYPDVIRIRAIVTPVMDEDFIPSGVESDTYDDQTLDDWYNFVDTVEGIVRNFGEVINISQSTHDNSLSEYIDFYSYGKDGNKKEYIIDLRLSDHASNNNARANRLNHVKKLDSNYQLEGVTINSNTYNSYYDAINAVRKILAKHLMK